MCERESVSYHKCQKPGTRGQTFDFAICDCVPTFFFANVKFQATQYTVHAIPILGMPVICSRVRKRERERKGDRFSQIQDEEGEEERKSEVEARKGGGGGN